jgi:hypothetical protein
MPTPPSVLEPAGTPIADRSPGFPRGLLDQPQDCADQEEDMGKRVLLIGKRAKVLVRLQDPLREVSIDAELTQDLTGAGIGDQGEYAAVAFGRGVNDKDRARMKAAFSAANRDVALVDGLAPITPLLVAQFEEALGRRPKEERRIAEVTVSGGRVVLDVRSDCRVRITSQRLDRLYRTHTEQAFDGRLAPGTHAIQLSRRLARARDAFVVARTDDEVHVGKL